MKIQPRFVAVLSILLFSSLVVQAQPTKTTIRIQHRDKLPPPAVTGSIKQSGKVWKAQVTVQARNQSKARRAALNYVRAEMLQRQMAPLANLRPWLRELVTATTELRNSARIVRERQNGRNLVMDVEIAGDPAMLASDFRGAALSNFRLVALLPEFVDGKRTATPKVETALAHALAERNFRVYDWRFVASNYPLDDLVETTVTGKADEFATLSNHLLANTIIAGRVDARFSQDNAGIISYVATANVRVIKADSGQILTAREWSEKGFGQDKVQAARNTLDELAATVAKELPDELLNRLETWPVNVQLATVTPERAEDFAVWLRSLPGVSNVQIETTQGGAQFHVVSRDKPAVLAAQIAQSRDFALEGY